MTPEASDPLKPAFTRSLTSNRLSGCVFRRVAVALICASVTALLASRINRCAPFEVLQEVHPADEVLPQVQLDMRSLRSAVESIRSVAKSRIVFAKNVPLPNEHQPEHPAQWPALPLRNVRLGTALSIVTEHFRQEPILSSLSYSEQSGEIVIDNSPSRPVYTRVYEVSDILARGQESQPRRTGSEQPPQGTSTGQDLEELCVDCSGTAPWVDSRWGAQVWGGFLIVTANSDQQRSIQKLLIALRRHCSISDSRRQR